MILAIAIKDIEVVIGVYQFLQCENNRYQTDFESLYQSALEKVKDRITDLIEIQRVLGKK